MHRFHNLLEENNQQDSVIIDKTCQTVPPPRNIGFFSAKDPSFDKNMDRGLGSLMPHQTAIVYKCSEPGLKLTSESTHIRRPSLMRIQRLPLSYILALTSITPLRVARSSPHLSKVLASRYKPLRPSYVHTCNIRPYTMSSATSFYDFKPLDSMFSFSSEY